MEMASVCSSMVRDARIAARVSSARVFSQSSLVFKSLSSSLCSSASMLSIASMTSSKWPEVIDAMRAANAERRLSLAPAAAARNASTAERRGTEAPLPEETCKKKKPPSWEAKERLKVSRASSLWRMAIALLMAASSPSRRLFRSFHSAFFASSADFTSPMYFVSSVTCFVRSPISAFASSLDNARAPFSFTIFSNASSAALNSSPLADFKLS
mmetsp:Transcript_91534/g.179277  ORF Transcript_91534/g.179277 Transcript_91534/m.179277 type:complete len:213 (-) Transcript_91534:150-788(-)